MGSISVMAVLKHSTSSWTEHGKISSYFLVPSFLLLLFPPLTFLIILLVMSMFFTLQVSWTHHLTLDSSNLCPVTISHHILGLFLICHEFREVLSFLHLFLVWHISKTENMIVTPQAGTGLTQHVASSMCGLFRLSDPILVHWESPHWGGPSP